MATLALDAAPCDCTCCDEPVITRRAAPLTAVDTTPGRSLLVARPAADPPVAASTTPQQIYVNFSGMPGGKGTPEEPFNTWAEVQPLLPAKGSGVSGPTVHVWGLAKTTLQLVGYGGTPYAPIRITLLDSPTAVLMIDGQQKRGSRDWPVVLGADITAGIEMDDCEHVEIEGLDAQRFMISGIAGVGIRATACDHVAVRRVTVEWTAQSGMLFTNAGDRTCPNTDLLVEGCVVQHTNLGSIPAGGSGCSALDFGTEAISIENHDGFEVRCCQVSNSLASGIGAAISMWELAMLVHAADCSSIAMP